jgi:diguanylate cyclase (GGDEF)-like protein
MKSLENKLLACVEIGKALTSTLDMEQIVSTIVERLSHLIRAQHWTLYLLDPVKGELRFEVVAGVPRDKLSQVRIRLGEGVAGKVAQSGEPLFLADVSRDKRVDRRVDGLTGLTTRSLITLPLMTRGAVCGVLQIVNPEDDDLFQPSSRPVLSILADFVAIAIDNAARHRFIQELTVTDDVTGYHNTRFMHDYLGKVFRPGRPLSLIFLDMDNFKQVDDTFGHLLGSKVLREIAAVIGGELSGEERLVRYGGDEYVAILPGRDKAQALALAGRIRAALNGARFLREEGHDIRALASFGVASCPEDAADVPSLLHMADERMYRSKARGKNLISAD